MKSRTLSIALMLTLLAAMALHIDHFMHTETPFSTDVWPIIRDARILIERPTIGVFNDSALDGYNNHWPASILMLVVGAEVTGMNIAYLAGLAMVLLLALILSLTIYSFASRAGGSGWVNILVYTSIPSLLVFTSAYVKEVYCMPLSLALMTLPFAVNDLRALTILAGLLSVGLAMSHHMGAIICVTTLLTLVAILIADYVLGRSTKLPTDLIKRISLALILSASAVALFNGVENLRALPIKPSPQDLLVFAMYFTAIMALIVVVSGRRPGTLRVAAIPALMATALLLGIRLGLAYGVRPPSISWVLIYATPLMVVAPLVYVSATELCRSLTVVVATLVSYIIFAKPAMSFALHRVLNYLGIAFSLSRFRVGSRRALTVLGSALMIALLLATVVCIAIDCGVDRVSFYWLYSREDVAVAHALRNLVGNSIFVVCGAKMGYLLAECRNPVPYILRKELPSQTLLLLSWIEIKLGLPQALSMYRVSTEPLHSCSVVMSSSSWIGILGPCRWRR